MKFFVVLSAPLRKNAGIVLKLGPYHFLPHSNSLFITNLTIQSYVIISAIDSLVTLPMNEQIIKSYLPSRIKLSLLFMTERLYVFHFREQFELLSVKEK